MEKNQKKFILKTSFPPFSKVVHHSLNVFALPKKHLFDLIIFSTYPVHFIKKFNLKLCNLSETVAV